MDKKQLFAVQSIDTMKQSRDRAREMLQDPSDNSLIDAQMTFIKAAGATHVAIDTPYDQEFSPILKQWVVSAREHGLSVWFRGNFSGWEGWFGYAPISREQHKKLLVAFIDNNPDIFQSGDVFTPCPECENGGPGDPRRTGDAAGYREFLVGERNLALREFQKQNKTLSVYASMNGDIARTVVNAETAHTLGGVVLVDHYVDTPEHFSRDVRAIAETLHAQVGVGEFGTPIPDIQGEMTEADQAEYIRGSLEGLYNQNMTVPVVNYWVLEGGSTALVSDGGTPRIAYDILKQYYTAPAVSGVVVNSLGERLDGMRISVASTTYSVDTRQGVYKLFLAGSHRQILVEPQDGYDATTIILPKTIATSTEQDIVLTPTTPSVWYKLRGLLYQVVDLYNQELKQK
ncbi:MAG: hypothetical protein ACYC8S_02760 [Minisyncoccota bacterium]